VIWRSRGETFFVNWLPAYVQSTQEGTQRFSITQISPVSPTALQKWLLLAHFISSTLTCHNDIYFLSAAMDAKI
jgi:hypothetical protein